MKARPDPSAARQAGGWDFWIDRGGTFTDVIGRDPRGAAACAQAAVREPRLSRTPRSRRSAACSALAPARRSRLARSASSRWARRSPPTRCSSGAASARCWSPRAAFATRSRSATRRGPKIFARQIIKPEQLYAGVVEIDERVLADGTVEAAPDPATRARGAGGGEGRGLSTRSRSSSCTPIAIPRMSGWSAAIARELGFAQVSESHACSRAHQARRARRHHGGRRLSVADPRALRRPGVAATRRRAHRRARHVHDVVGRPDLGRPLRRQGRDPVRPGGRRGGDGAHRPRAPASGGSSASTWAAPRPTSPISTANSSARSRPRSRACGCARR